MFGQSTLSYLLFKRTVLLSSLAKLVYSLCDGFLSVQNLLYVVVQSTHVARVQSSKVRWVALRWTPASACVRNTNKESPCWRPASASLRSFGSETLLVVCPSHARKQKPNAETVSNETPAFELVRVATDCSADCSQHTGGMGKKSLTSFDAQIDIISSSGKNCLAVAKQYSWDLYCPQRAEQQPGSELHIESCRLNKFPGREKTSALYSSCYPRTAV